MWKIVEVRPGDGPTIARHRYADAGASAADYDAYERWVAAAIGAGKYLGCFAMHDGKVAGGAGLTILDWGPVRGDAGSERGRIVNVFTAPAWRRKGVARSLVSALLNRAESAGIRTIGLGATMESRGLYEALGFHGYPAEMIRRG